MPLQRKPDAHNQYSSPDEGFEKNLEINDNDLMDLEADLDNSPETDESSLASLAAFDPDDDGPIEPPEDWLIEVRALARKHGPFTPAQIVQIIRELSALADEAGR